MLPVLAIVVISVVVSAFNAHALVERIFDRWLLDAAHSLGSQVRFQGGQASVQLSPQSESVLTYDVVDRIFYEVLQDGRHVAGQPGLPQLGRKATRYRHNSEAFDASYGGIDVRVGRVQVQGPHGDSAVVLVAETRTKRELALRAQVLVFAPVAILAVVAWLVVSSAVRRTLRPLRRMAQAWNDGSHTSLEPMATQDVPRELMPFAVALNDLLARVRELLLRERHFAATAAHQLRTPLAGLQLGLARAAACPDLASTRAALDELASSTQRAARMVQQLLALSRVDPAARGAIEMVDVDLVALAREVGEAYMDAAQARHTTLELDAGEQPVHVQGQPSLLSEALGNLIDNALRYTPPGGRVTISVRPEPPALGVADSGPGIAADETDKVFDRFVRGRGMTGEGSGLGLAIVKEITALHRAEIVLGRSEELGGLAVTLRFPAA
nr:sensor histidine kinase [Ramlibacter agri]